MKLLVFGSCNIDRVYRLPHIVAPGETERTCDYAVFPGGKGLNQAIAAAAAGAAVFFAGAVGKDGDLLTETLARRGVDISLLQTTDGESGHAVIQVSDSGENAIFLYPGANETVGEAYIDAVLGHFGAGDLLLLQNEISNLPYLVARARQRGMHILLNPSPVNERLRDVDFAAVNCLILNEVEMRALGGDENLAVCLQNLAARYPHLQILLTLGKDGCLFAADGSLTRQAAFETVTVDTTAAGDTFTGYFAAALARGEDLGEALQCASAAAAIAVSRKGAAPSIPPLAEVRAARAGGMRELQTSFDIDPNQP